MSPTKLFLFLGNISGFLAGQGDSNCFRTNLSEVKPLWFCAVFYAPNNKGIKGRPLYGLLRI